MSRIFMTPPPTHGDGPIIAPDGTLIRPDVSGLYDVTAWPDLTYRLIDWNLAPCPTETAVASWANAFALPVVANAWGNEGNVSAPDAFRFFEASKITSMKYTFGGTFAGGEIVTLRILPQYDPPGPLYVPPSLKTVTAAGILAFTPAEIQGFANKKLTPRRFRTSVMTSVPNSQVTLAYSITTD
jgi:hypothetical protein